MFGLSTVMTALTSAIAVAELEAQRLSVLEKTMKPEDFKAYMAQYEADKAEQRRIDTEERRHQEHCEAIRSTSFWRFGS